MQCETHSEQNFSDRTEREDAALDLLSRHPWHTFLSLTGGSVLYCLSALSIIYGIMEMLGPLLSEIRAFSEALPCLGALNLYEIALLGVLAFIVVRQNVTDDAVSLVILVALFLIGSGLALSTVANSGATWALVIGACCFALAVAKIWALRRYVEMSIDGIVFAGMALLMAWNFGAGPVLARLSMDARVVRADWLVAWLALLLGAGVVTWETLRRIAWSAARTSESTQEPEPFIRRHAMCTVFILILLVSAMVHQHVLGYVHDICGGFSDYLPILCLLSLLAVGLVAGLRPSAGYLCASLSLMPLAVFGLTIANRAFAANSASPIDFLWHPPFLFTAMAIVLLQTGVRARMFPLAWCSVPYGLAVVLTYGFVPGPGMTLHWHATGVLLLAALLAAGAWRRSIALCVAGVVMAVSGACTTETWLAWTEVHGLTQWGAFSGCAGGGLLIVAMIFGRRTPPAVILIGALGMAVFAFDFFQPRPAVRDLSVWVVSIALATGIAVRVREWKGPAVLSLPLLHRLWLVFTGLAAWRFVLLSFVLLFVGAWFSARKGRRMSNVAGASIVRTQAVKLIQALIRWTLVAMLLAWGLMFIAGMFVPICCQGPSRSRARRIACANNLKQIGLGVKMYASDHDEDYPAAMRQLERYVDGQPRLFICPQSGLQAGSFASVDSWSDYRYVKGRTEASAPDAVLAYCSPKNHDGEGANVLFCDGRVEWFNSESRQEPEDRSSSFEGVMRRERAETR